MDLIHTVLIVPPITWIPKYDFKKNIAADLIAGFTVAIMHIPQVGGEILSSSNTSIQGRQLSILISSKLLNSMDTH